MAVKIDSTRQLDSLDFGKGNGLIPVITQHALTGEVLMTAFANREALERTLETGDAWYYSRSREQLWRKGDTSGNVQRVVAVHADCDGDAVLLHVLPAGPTCHTGEWSCFDAPTTLPALAEVLKSRAAVRPGGSYTTRLLEDRNLRLKKLGEEATELALACVNEEEPKQVASEAADLVYHVLVACQAAGVTVTDILEELALRFR